MRTKTKMEDEADEFLSNFGRLAGEIDVQELREGKREICNNCR